MVYDAPHPILKLLVVFDEMEIFDEIEIFDEMEIFDVMKISDYLLLNTSSISFTVL